MKELQPKDYKSEVKPVWCPGCGDYGVLEALARVFAKLEIPKHNIFIATGIGCSSRIAGYFDTYGINGVHGRAIPIAQGVKLGSLALGQDITVLAIGGDGDFFSIGSGHLPHAARRNIDITCIMLDNQVYAMTKGQTSPTTPPCFGEDGVKSIRTSHALNPPVDPLLDMLTYGTKFLGQGLATNVPHLAELLESAIIYKGFSFVSIQSHCVSFQEKEWAEHLKRDCRYLKEGEMVELPNGESWQHDPSNKNLARKLVEVALRERPYYGIIYQEKKVTAASPFVLVCKYMKKFEILEHRGDFKIRAFGKTKEALFLNALLGMEAGLRPEKLKTISLPAGRQGGKRKINIKSLDFNALLVDFLSEALYLIHVNKEIYDKIRFKKFSDTNLEAELTGQKIERFSEDIKAVTYHGLDIQQRDDGLFEATVLFDV